MTHQEIVDYQEMPVAVEAEVQQFMVLEDDSLLLGDSAHHALIVLDSDDKKWVMKANNVSLKKAENEIEMLEKFQKEGIPTLPLNGVSPFIVRTSDTFEPTAELYIPYVEGIQPLTRLEWGEHFGSESYISRASNMKECVSLAAKMHKRGYKHGDFEIKNIAQLRSGKYITFDLENASELSQENEVEERAKDLVSLLKSTRINGLFANTNLNVVEEEVSNILYTYCEKFNLDDTSIEVVELAQEKFMSWIKDPEAVSRALSRFMISRA
jgi:tRNA A-37 threonylcarbamoyl transferase component Bud32